MNPAIRPKRPRLVLPKPPHARPAPPEPQRTLPDEAWKPPAVATESHANAVFAQTIPDQEETAYDQQVMEATMADQMLAGDEVTQSDEAWMTPVVPGTGQDYLAAGAVLAGRYEIVALIGEGGMARVYQARDLKFNGLPVAIKCLHVGLSANPVVRQRFQNEAILARSLEHPNVVRIYDIFESETGFLCIAMAFLQGKDFRGWMAENRGKDTFLPQALAVVRDACLALKYAHQKNAVHRDVKPENIFVTKDNQVLIMDFGIAKLLQEIEGTQGYATTHHVTQSVVGTPAYMAPEQFEPGAEIDGRADQYAIGVMLYEILTGRLPSGRFKLPSELVPGLGAFYDGLIEKSLSQDKGQRFGSMAEFLAELEKSPHLPKGGGGWKMSPLTLASLGLVAGAVVLLVLFYLQHSLLLWCLALALLVPVMGVGLLEWRGGGAARSREAKTMGKILLLSGVGLAVGAVALLLEKTL